MGKHEGVKHTVDQDLAWKILDNEGLDYSIMHYFGQDLQSDNPHLNDIWSQAYDLLHEIRDILNDATRD